MVKSTKDKKLILGSALAGLILAGPGLSVTATSAGKFFQTAELKAGYRLAQAEDKPAATPMPVATPKPTSDTKKSDKPATSGATTTPAKSGGEMKCGAGACGGGK